MLDLKEKRNKTLKSLALKRVDSSGFVETFFSSLSYFEVIFKIIVQRSCFRCKSSEGKLGIGEPPKNTNLLGNSPDSWRALLQTLF